MSQPIGRLDVAALDCPDAAALAAFDQAIIGGEIVARGHGGWVEVHTPDPAGHPFCLVRS